MQDRSSETFFGFALLKGAVGDDLLDVREVVQDCLIGSDRMSEYMVDGVHLCRSTGGRS